MIQAIVLTLIAIWLAYGLVNVIRGLAQILCGLACGVAAIFLYTLAYTLEFVAFVARNLVAVSGLKGHLTSAAKSASVRPSTRSKNSAS